MSIIKEKIELEIAEAELGTQQILVKLPVMLRWAVVIGVIMIIPAYYIAKNIAQSQWTSTYKKNLLVAKPSFVDAKAPAISSTTLIPWGGGDYSAVAKIQNQNLNLSLKPVTYTMKFYNSQHKLIGSASDQIYLLPNETTYLIAPKVFLPEPAASAEVNFPQNLQWQNQTNLPVVKIISSTTQTYEQLQPPALVVEGVITNTSPYNIHNVDLVILVKNSAGQIVAASLRQESDLTSHERRAIRQLWPNFFSADIGSAEIYTTANILDKNNITTPNVGGTASDLSRPTGN